jgi:hypothetical protein
LGEEDLWQAYLRWWVLAGTTLSSRAVSAAAESPIVSSASSKLPRRPRNSKRLLRTVLGLTRRQPICRCPPTSTPKWLPGIASPLDTVRFYYSGSSVPIMELDLVIATPLESALQVSSAIFGGVSFRQYFAPRRVLLSYLLSIGVYPGRIQEVKPCYSNDHPSVVSDSFEQ